MKFFMCLFLLSSVRLCPMYLCAKCSTLNEKIDTTLPKLHDYQEQGHRDDNDFDENVEEDFLVTEASQMISRGDIAIVKTGNDYLYYLVKLTCDPCTTESDTKYDYNHTYPTQHRIVIGNYPEIHQDTKDGTISYLENKWKAIISCFSIIGVSPELEFIQGKGCEKTEDMYLVAPDVHEATCN